MRALHLVSLAVAFTSGFTASLVACATSSDTPGTDTNTSLPGATNDASSNASEASSPSSPPNASEDSGAATCVLCVTDQDCAGGETCAQFAGDTYCAPACGAAGACGANAACTTANDVAGDPVTLCLPTTGACAVTPGTPHADAGSSSVSCKGFDGPDVSSVCTGCGTHTCQANGCYGGWFCNTQSKKCQAPPASCTAPTPDGGPPPPPPPPFDAGATPTGSVGTNGGTLSRLLFAVVGDTRPPAINDTAGYPSAVITKIYQDIEALTPRPAFVVSTGDYLFSTANGTAASPQLDMYVAARQNYTGVLFPAMGNHECTGGVTSNCGTGNANGITTNYSQFLQKLLAPIGQTNPNYVIHVDATDGSWTSKLVFVAGNAWTSADATWLDTTLAQPTTYTFIIRHEPKAASTAPGCGGSETIMAKYPYTLAIVGHTHTYTKSGPKQVTMGNGGAPLTGSSNYGFGLLSQRADGAIQVDMIETSTGQPDASFRFAVKADGSAAP